MVPVSAQHHPQIQDSVMNNDPESIWCFAMLIALHNGSSYDEAETQAALAASVADAALTEWQDRWGELDCDQ